MAVAAVVVRPSFRPSSVRRSSVVRASSSSVRRLDRRRRPSFVRRRPSSSVRRRASSRRVGRSPSSRRVGSAQVGRSVVASRRVIVLHYAILVIVYDLSIVYLHGSFSFVLVPKMFPVKNEQQLKKQQ